MRWADDGDVEAEGIVPTVVEGRGCDHYHATPTGEERTERAAESPDLNGGSPGGGIGSKGGGKNQIDAGESHQYAAQLDRQVRWGPESVAANAHVPGNVPVKPEEDGSGAEKGGPGGPGDGGRASA